MVDTVSQARRSEIMRRVKSGNTTPEIMLRKELWKKGVRGWCLHADSLPGKPDIVFRKKKLAVFVDGCFWHGCPNCYRRPNSRQDYWDNKVKKNVNRDKLNQKALLELGWKVLRFWEHEISENVEKCASRILKVLNSRSSIIPERFTKYDKSGGIRKVFFRLSSRKSTLASIAEELGYCKETVRQDLINYFGKEAYNKMKKNRKRIAEPNDLELDLQSAIKALRKYRDSENENLSCTLNILSKAKRADISLIVNISQPFTKKSLRIRLIDGRKALVQTAIAPGDLKEHHVGIHRFKPRKVDADFCIFGICGEKSSVAYVFYSKDIKGIKSLNLRFDRFERESKYDYARERWDILTGP